MKQLNLTIIFIGSLLIIPLALIAQTRDSANKIIIIKNGDTTINGKPLGEFSKQEKSATLNELQQFQFIHPGLLLKDTLSLLNRVSLRRVRRPFTMSFGGDTAMITQADTLVRRFHRRIDDGDIIKILPREDISVRTPYNLHPGGEEHLKRPFSSLKERPNSQSFSYYYTDKDGISSRMQIQIVEPSSSQLTQIISAEKSDNTLPVEDLTLFPNFASGKLGISFNLAQKGNTSIKLLDTNYKALFSDQQTSIGIYLKHISIPKNGIYYIHIKQGNSSFVRRIIKE